MSVRNLDRRWLGLGLVLPSMLLVSCAASLPVATGPTTSPVEFGNPGPSAALATQPTVVPEPTPLPAVPLRISRAREPRNKWLDELVVVEQSVDR